MSSPRAHEARAFPAQDSKTRYRVLAMAFLLAVVLYLDRAAISILMPAIRRELGLGPLAAGWIFSAFVWGYAAFNIPVGWLGDRFGARRVLTVIVILWSAFTAATALAWNLWSLLVIRFLFGAAEAGATPCISQSFSRWTTVRERALAQGVYFSGMSAGAAFAAPLVTLLLVWFSWRAALFTLGVAGLGWAAAWAIWYRDEPAQHRSVNAAECRLLDRPRESVQGAPLPWRTLLRDRNLLAILLMYFTYGYTGYIYISWFPSYLQEARHLPAEVTGFLASVPPILGLAAKPLGGWWSDLLAERRGLVGGRRIVGVTGFGLGALAVPPGLFVQDPYWSVFFLGVADAAAALAHGVCFAVILDIAAKRAGTVSAMMLTMGSLGNAVSALTFGAFLQYGGSYTPPFLLGVAMNLVGALLWLVINPSKRLV